MGLLSSQHRRHQFLYLLIHGLQESVPPLSTTVASQALVGIRGHLYTTLSCSQAFTAKYFRSCHCFDIRQIVDLLLSSTVYHANLVTTFSCCFWALALLLSFVGRIVIFNNIVKRTKTSSIVSSHPNPTSVPYFVYLPSTLFHSYHPPIISFPRLSGR